MDLDVVRKQKERGWMDPLAYLTGRHAAHRARQADHAGRGGSVPVGVGGSIRRQHSQGACCRSCCRIYSRTPENPNGINMDDPFELPSKIREIQVGKGEAVVVQ